MFHGCTSLPREVLAQLTAHVTGFIKRQVASSPSACSGWDTKILFSAKATWEKNSKLVIIANPAAPETPELKRAREEASAVFKCSLDDLGLVALWDSEKFKELAPAFQELVDIQEEKILRVVSVCESEGKFLLLIEMESGKIVEIDPLAWAQMFDESTFFDSPQWLKQVLSHCYGNGEDLNVYAGMGFREVRVMCGGNDHVLPFPMTGDMQEMLQSIQRRAFYSKASFSSFGITHASHVTSCSKCPNLDSFRRPTRFLRFQYPLVQSQSDLCYLPLSALVAHEMSDAFQNLGYQCQQPVVDFFGLPSSETFETFCSKRFSRYASVPPRPRDLEVGP